MQYHYDLPIYIDTYTNGHCIRYGKDYEKDFGIKNPFEYYFDFKHENKVFKREISMPFTQPVPIKYGRYNLKYMDKYHINQKRISKDIGYLKRIY